jgi:uncharacterized LabA/DUF88 family protein
MSSSGERPPRVEIFVDGTNFYLAQRHAGMMTQVDMNLLATRLSRGYHFVKLRFYTSPLPNQESAAYRAQQRFFAELEQSRRIELVLGRHKLRVNSETGKRFHVEKETDVNLAVDMVVGAYEERYDVALLVAGDSDYVRAVRAVQHRGKELVWCHLPSQRHTHHLAQLCDRKVELDEKFLRTCAIQGRSDRR